MEECRELSRIVNLQSGSMRHMRTVFCSLAVLVLVGIWPAVGSTDTLPDTTTDAWGEVRKLCLQMANNSRCDSLIDAVSGKGKSISFPSSGDTLTDAINEAWFQSVAYNLIQSNSRDPDVVSMEYKNSALFACISSDKDPDICINKHLAKFQVITARITARAKAAIGDKKRFRHCKESLAPIDDPAEIVECLEKLDAILASCGRNKPCVTDNFTAYYALLIYTTNWDDKDRYGPFVSRCQEQYQNLSGLGYREIWACVQNYLGLLNEAPGRTGRN